MTRSIMAACAALAFAAPALAQTSTQAAEAPDLDQQVRCAGLFAIVAGEQVRKVPGSDRFPPLAERGKEFFVGTGMRLIRERQMTEAELGPYFRAQIAVIQEDYAKAADPRARTDAEMQSCLTMLDRVLPVKAGN